VRRLRLWLLLAFLLLPMVWPMPVLAAEPIRLLASEAHNEFPQRVAFDLKVEGDAEITSATFYYHIGDSPVLTYARPEFSPGRQATVEYVIKGQQDYLPPGAEINYYWQVEDAAGHELKTEPAMLVLDDVRFQWKEIAAGKIVLRWYKGDEEFARDLLKAGTEALDKLSTDAGVQVEKPVKILIYGSQQDLLGALEPKAQEWTGGRSFSELGIILIAGDTTDSGRAFARRAVPHELSHVVIHQATENPYGDIPHWLDEGLAMRAEGTVEPMYSAALQRAIRDHKLISLQSLGSNFPADTSLAALSYAESESVVQFIVDRYGPEKMARLLAVFREGSTYDDATKQALGLSINELDAAWRKSLGVEDTPSVDTGSAVSGVATYVPAGPSVGATAPLSLPIPVADLWVPLLIVIGGGAVLVRLRARR